MTHARVVAPSAQDERPVWLAAAKPRSAAYECAADGCEYRAISLADPIETFAASGRQLSCPSSLGQSTDLLRMPFYRFAGIGHCSKDRVAPGH
jgi:hypothetical protein